MKKYILMMLPLAVMMIFQCSCGNDAGSGAAGNTDSSSAARDTSAAAVETVRPKDGTDQTGKQEDGQKIAMPSDIKNTLPSDIRIGTTTYDLRDLAKICIRRYKEHPEMQAKPYTEAVFFRQAELKEWIDKMNGADSISIEWGLYTEPFIKAINALNAAHRSDDLNTPYPRLNLQRLENRLSVFLFAYKGVDSQGKPAEYKPANNVSSAYNLGNLHP